MNNEHGLDVGYFSRKLKIVLRDIKHYTPDELARELARLSQTSSSNVLLEPEFNYRKHEK